MNFDFQREMSDRILQNKMRVFRRAMMMEDERLFGDCNNEFYLTNEALDHADENQCLRFIIKRASEFSSLNDEDITNYPLKLSDLVTAAREVSNYNPDLLSEQEDDLDDEDDVDDESSFNSDDLVVVLSFPDGTEERLKFEELPDLIDNIDELEEESISNLCMYFSGVYLGNTLVIKVKKSNLPKPNTYRGGGGSLGRVESLVDFEKLVGSETIDFISSWENASSVEEKRAAIDKYVGWLELIRDSYPRDYVFEILHYIESAYFNDIDLKKVFHVLLKRIGYDVKEYEMYNASLTRDEEDELLENYFHRRYIKESVSESMSKRIRKRLNRL
ncbi:MAG: hypothetical protein IRZ03_13185 [Acidobacterium ailaaui]|nr:hypothetical protein [Pseudacidobacterium ailaaui]